MRPPAPMTPTRSVSLAPRTRVDARAVSPVPMMKVRRSSWYVMASMLAGREGQGKLGRRVRHCVSPTLGSAGLRIDQTADRSGAVLLGRPRCTDRLAGPDSHQAVTAHSGKNSGAGNWFFAEGANPTFGAILDNLNVGKAGAGKEFAMLVDPQEGHAGSRGVFFGKLRNLGDRSFIDFGNDDERAAGLGNAKDLAHVAGQVGPPEVGFHGSDEIEHGIGKRQLRNGAVADLDATKVDPLRVRSFGRGDALFGIIDAVYFSVRGDGRQLADRPAAAATDVEDGVVAFDGDVLQTPIGQPG